MALTFEMRAELTAPPEAVWSVITNWERLHEWMLELSDLSVTSPIREGVGVQAEATIRIGGMRTIDSVRVSVWEPPRKLVIDHIGWVKGYGEMLLTPMADGDTYFVWTEVLRPPLGPLGSIGLLAWRRMLRHAFERDVRLLAGLVSAC